LGAEYHQTVTSSLCSVLTTNLAAIPHTNTDELNVRISSAAIVHGSCYQLSNILGYSLLIHHIDPPLLDLALSTHITF